MHIVHLSKWMVLKKCAFVVGEVISFKYSVTATDFASTLLEGKQY